MLPIFIITFILGHSIILTLGEDVNCGPRLPLVVNGSNTYYYGFVHLGTAIQAEIFCRKHNMDLLSIETPEEDAFIQESLINYLDLNSGKITFIWTSGKRNDGNNWIWGATGKPIHYTNWWTAQPDNAGGIENCLEMWHDPNYPGVIKWNDRPCEATERYFICEYNNNDS